MAAWLKHLGMPASIPDHIVLTAGAQHGLTTTLWPVLQAGDTLLMEELTYSGARMLAQQMQLKMRGVAMDAEGLRPDALETGLPLDSRSRALLHAEDCRTRHRRSCPNAEGARSRPSRRGTA